MLYTSTIRSLTLMLTRAELRQGIWIVSLMFVNTILDFFSIASFLPLIVLLINPDSIHTNNALHSIFRFVGTNTASTFIILLTAGILAFTVLKNLIGLCITRSKAKYVFTVGSELSKRALSQYFKISHHQFIQIDYTRELNRITNLPLAFANNIVMPLTVLLSEGTIFLFLLVGVAIYDLRIFMFIGAILIPTGILYGMVRKRYAAFGDDLKKKYPLTLKYAMQVVEGLPDIKTFNKFPFFRKRFDNASRELANTFADEHTAQSGASRITEIVAAAMICTLIIYSVLSAQNYVYTMITLSIYAAASFRMFPSMNRILSASTQLRTHAYLFAELDTLKNISQPIYPETIKSRIFKEKISLENIAYEYTNGVEVLKQVTVNIHKGDKIALVGKSGAGKTTLIMIILQFLQPKRGTIRLDGEEIIGSDPSWSRLFSYVPQNPYILDGSILENIAFGCSQEGINVERVKECLRMLELDDMITKLPDGINTLIGERGVKLSGGQRQRIAIARALYADAPIMLLDEITNHLDKVTEQEILKNIDKIAGHGKTMLMVTHHEHLLKNFGRVFIVNNGIIEEPAYVHPNS